MDLKTDQIFTKESIKKKVNEEIRNDSFTLIPCAAGLLGLLWGILFSSPIALSIGAVGFITGIGNYLFKKLRRFSQISEKHINAIRQEQKDLLVKKLDSLGHELKSLDCQQGAEQVSRLKLKFDDLTQMIEEKLNDNDLRTSRLNGLAEQLYLATIENLDHVRQILKSVQNIDLQYIDSQIKRSHSAEERESLEERKSLKIQGHEEAEKRIAKNEVAMTKLNMITMQLAQKKGSQIFDMESSLHEITNNVRVEKWNDH